MHVETHDKITIALKSAVGIRVEHTHKHTYTLLHYTALHSLHYIYSDMYIHIPYIH